MPYGVQQTNGTTSEFMGKHDYALLLDCDGQTDIPYDALPEADRARYDPFIGSCCSVRCG